MKSKEKAPEGVTNNTSDYTPYSLECQIQGLIMNATSDKPIRRKDLVRATQTDDRTVRLAIEILRHNGERIIAHEKGGYYYAETEAQYRAWRSSITTRIVNMSSMLKAMDKATKGQVKMDV